MKLYIGTSGYAYGGWKGTFYPNRIPGSEMLKFYARHFNTVEINNSFYRMPKPGNIRAWVGNVPPGFLFCLKAPRRITHRKTFDDIDRDLNYFLEVVNTFGSHLGAILFQFPKTVEPHPGRLENILRHVSEEHPSVFEFRSDVPAGREIGDILKSKGAQLCVSDTDESPQFRITGKASWGYVRLRRSNYSGEDLERWHEMIISQQWNKIFIFFKHEETGSAPRMAIEFGKLFPRRAC